MCLTGNFNKIVYKAIGMDVLNWILNIIWFVVQMLQAIIKSCPVFYETKNLIYHKGKISSDIPSALHVHKLIIWHGFYKAMITKRILTFHYN